MNNDLPTSNLKDVIVNKSVLLKNKIPNRIE